MHIPHELQDEFPAETKFIAQLAKTDHQFRKLTARYDEVNRNIHRIESEEQPTADDVLERLKKERLALKDDIAATLRKLERRM